MDKRTSDAVAHVHEAIKKLPPCNSIKAVGRNKDGQTIFGEHTPLATVRRAFVLALCREAKEKNPVVEAITRGCSHPTDEWPPEHEECLIQTQDLWHLLDQVAGMKPPAAVVPTSVAIAVPPAEKTPDKKG